MGDLVQVLSPGQRDDGSIRHPNYNTQKAPLEMKIFMFSAKIGMGGHHLKGEIFHGKPLFSEPFLPQKAQFLHTPIPNLLP